VALLPHKQILGLHAAVVSAQLTSSRAVLLGGLDPSFADGLPVCASPSAQIMSDLHGLNAAAALGDGTVPAPGARCPWFARSSPGAVFGDARRGVPLQIVSERARDRGFRARAHGRAPVYFGESRRIVEGVVTPYIT
jgi:hypothetical protein